jgi:RNA polymerase sigma-70 factor, ECF subfamily
MTSGVIDRAKTWEREAFGLLYDESYDRVYRFIFYRVLDTIQTEDIISTVYHKALRSIRKFRGTTAWEYYSWLFQIAYTTIVDASRSAHIIESLEDISWEPSYDEDRVDTLAKKEKLTEVLVYIKTLSQKEQAIITMRIWDDMSYEDIAHITGESPSTIRKITSRTLTKIAANVSALSFLTFILHVWTI